MSYIRRALILSVGVSAGVCTAPHLCATHKTPTEPSAHYRSHIALGTQSGFHGGFCGRKSAEEGATGATTEQASVPFVDEALWTLFRHANDLLDTTTQALVKGITMTIAAATVACTHGEVHATTFSHAPTSVTRSNIASAHFDDDPPCSSEEEDRATDSTTDASVGSSAYTQSVLPKKTSSLRSASHRLKDRFMYYARRDPATGEFVLSLEGFVRCMLLLPDDGGIDAGWLHRHARAKDDDAAITHRNSSKVSSIMCEHSSNDDVANAAGCQRPSRPASSWHHQLLPSSVQQRFADFFQWVDLDGTNSIGYAEFVVLFTFLSTPQETLARAFRVFDLDGGGRLSECDFCRLLNTIMVDPAVHVHYTDGATSAGVSKKKDCTVMSEPAGAVSPMMYTSHASTESRASTRRRGEGVWRRTRDALTFDVGSEMIQPFLFGPLPLHVGAPPDVTYHHKKSTVSSSLYPTGTVPSLTTTARSTTNNAPQAVVFSTGMVSAPSGLSEPVWWRRSWHSLQHIVRKVWPHHSSSAQPNHHPTSRGGPSPACISAPATSTDSSVSPCMSSLQLMAQEDTLLKRVSYPTLLYRLDYLRWELRAIEFGLCDAFNSGVISLDDCRRLLHGSPCSTMERRRSVNAPPDAIPVTWSFYKKLFDVMRESDRIMWALQLALDAMPPVPEEMLRGGAIPDEALEAATGSISNMVRLSAVRHASTTGGKGMDGRGAACPASAAATTAEGLAASQHCGDRNAASLSFNAAGVTTSDFTSGDSPCESVTTCRDGSSSLVRPTALTWDQFNRVLHTIGTVVPLQGAEEVLFRALFDRDGSDSLSPAEFARVCAIKERFFAKKLPRFDEPKRNAVQQFFHCMQQLN